MGNVASVGLVKESGFTTTKSLFDFDTNEIKSDLSSCQETAEHVDHNINRKLSVDYSDIKDTGVSRSNSYAESGYAIPSLLSMIGLAGTESTTLLNAMHETTTLNFVQAAGDGTDKLVNIKSESYNVKVPRNKKMAQQNARVMPPAARKNGYIAKVEENNLCVYNFMWVCSYGSFTAVPRALNRLTRNRSVPPPSSPLMKAVKGLHLNMNQTPLAQSAVNRISALSRRNQANAFRNRHLRRTQLQAPLPATAAVVARPKAVQNGREDQIVDAVMKRSKQGEGKSWRKVQIIDPNNNDTANENNENSSIIVSIKNIHKITNTSNSVCGSKTAGKIKIALPSVPSAVPAAVNVVGRKGPPLAQQPPQKFTLGNPRNRKHYRATPLIMTTPKLAMTKRTKSHSLSHVPSIA